MAAVSRTLPFLVPSRRAEKNAGTQPLRTLLVNDGESSLDCAMLQSAGYGIYPVTSAEEALREFPCARPDLILVDCSDCREIIRILREWTNVPIVVISERTEESEKIECLDVGADDYLTKPFSMGELLARLRAALRRAFGIPRDQVFVAGDLRIDFGRRTVFVGKELVKLTCTEYELLKILVCGAGAVRTHRQLIHALWGKTQYQDALHLLRVTMSNLRRKLTREPNTVWSIATEPRVGYRLGKEGDWAQVRESH
jgi:two-component system KDP operon response regulator KdpE